MPSADGGMAAAAKTSLPERSEGGRNYDYRYAWIRDQCYVGQSTAAAGQHPLLDAAEALLLFAAAARHDRLDRDGFRAAETAVAAIAARWHEPDAGIWELGDRPWTHSRLICAAGIRRIADVAPDTSREGEWTERADTILAQTTAHATHPDGHWQAAGRHSVVDPDVDRPEGFLGGHGRGLDLCRVGHVGGHGEGVAAPFLDIGDRGVEASLASREENDVGAPLGVESCGGPADTGAGPGDDNGLLVHARPVRLGSREGEPELQGGVSGARVAAVSSMRAWTKACGRLPRNCRWAMSYSSEYRPAAPHSRNTPSASSSGRSSCRNR